MKLLLLQLVALSTQLAPQEYLDKWARNLFIEYTVVNNLVRTTEFDYPANEDESAFEFRISITNTGTEELNLQPHWSIYFYHSDTILRVNSTDPIYEPFNIGQGLEVAHVDGQLWTITPVIGEWAPLKIGEMIEINLKALGWVVSDSTIMPNWYIACVDYEECSAKNLESTKVTADRGFTFNRPDFVTEFRGDKMTKRDVLDASTVPMAPDVWMMNNNLKVVEDGKSVEKYGVPILPVPSFIETKPSTLEVQNGKEQPRNGVPISSRKWIYDYQENLACPNPICKECLPQSGQGTGGTQCKCQVLEERQIGEKCIPSSTTQCSTWLIRVGYLHGGDKWRLATSSDIVLDIATCEDIPETLSFITKLIDKVRETDDAMIFTGTMSDAGPRFEHRGVFIDVARNFYQAGTISSLMNIMQRVNLNVLHLKLADNEGWRLEIPELPKLTELGASRCHDPAGHSCLMPQLGSGADVESHGTGHFTVATFRGLLAEASRKGITIIPELGAPGHSKAAVRAMDERSGDSSKEGDFRLSDPDQVELSADSHGFYNNVMNPCINGTRNFLEVVTKSLWATMEDSSHKMKHIHIGGNQVNMEVIKSSPACQAIMAERKINAEQILHEFFQWYVTMTSNVGFQIHAWQDIFTYDDEKTGYKEVYPVDEWELANGTSITAYHHRSRWNTSETEVGHLLANAGYRTVLMPTTHLNFDAAQSPDPQMRGSMNDARFSDLVKVFSFRPLNFYENALYDFWGNRQNTPSCDNSIVRCTSLSEPDNIVGIHAGIWSQEILEGNHFYKQLFPRLFAFAQRAWAEGSWEQERRTDPWAIFQDQKFLEDFNYFRYSLRYELDIMESNKQQYWLPKPGAYTQNSGWGFNTLLKYNDIMFRQKGDSDTRWRTLSEVAHLANTETLMEMVTCGKAFINDQPLYISPPMEFIFSERIFEEPRPDSATSLLPSFFLFLSIFYLF
ncbi:Oidioi.mRNA.OKI2018_I69.PAR.g8749.t1.cds [Oikopleura dioica]|uniref:beta-N-acetylhexosaminidase n=1 Tax=Oikopleura dioica TaxID=34765 RepID=A0ABN7RHD6_OIKDI|nr:Oidioi.mRNA.OKI2018_I69.PAR.g8749.t1.cds [Oikopleura dioica]